MECLCIFLQVFLTENLTIHCLFHDGKQMKFQAFDLFKGGFTIEMGSSNSIRLNVAV